VFRMLCRITQSSDAHRTDSVSVMDHEQTMGVNSRVLDQKQQNIFVHVLCDTLASALSVNLRPTTEDMQTDSPSHKCVISTVICSAYDRTTQRHPIGPLDVVVL